MNAVRHIASAGHGINHIATMTAGNIEDIGRTPFTLKPSDDLPDQFFQMHLTLANTAPANSLKKLLVDELAAGA